MDSKPTCVLNPRYEAAAEDLCGQRKIMQLLNSRIRRIPPWSTGRLSVATVAWVVSTRDSDEINCHTGKQVIESQSGFDPKQSGLTRPIHDPYTFSKRPYELKERCEFNNWNVFIN